MNRQRNLQISSDLFGQAVERTDGSGVTSILEPVNTRVDHPGPSTDRTATRSVARAIGSDRFRILYDLYHSVVQGEDPATDWPTPRAWSTTSSSPTCRAGASRAAAGRLDRSAGRLPGVRL